LVQYLLINAIHQDDDAKIAAIPKYMWDAANIEMLSTMRLKRVKSAAERCQLTDVVGSIDAILKTR